MIAFCQARFRRACVLTAALACVTVSSVVMAQPGVQGGKPGSFSRMPTPPQGNGYQAHDHSAANAPRYVNKRKTPLAQMELADAIVDDALNRMWEQGDRHFHEGEYNHAVNLNRIIVQGDPHNMTAYENSAYLLWSTDRTDEAIAFLKEGLKSNPKQFGLYDEIGWHYYNSAKQPDKAIPYYEQAVKYNAPFFTWHNLARCYEKTNQWEKAVKTWEVAVKFPAPTAGATANVPAENALRRARAELAKRQKNR